MLTPANHCATEANKTTRQTHNVRVAAAVQLPLRRHGQTRCFALPVSGLSRAVRIPRLEVGRRQEGGDHRLEFVSWQPGQGRVAPELNNMEHLVPGQERSEKEIEISHSVTPALPKLDPFDPFYDSTRLVSNDYIVRQNQEATAAASH